MKTTMTLSRGFQFRFQMLLISNDSDKVLFSALYHEKYKINKHDKISHSNKKKKLTSVIQPPIFQGEPAGNVGIGTPNMTQTW